MQWLKRLWRELIGNPDCCWCQACKADLLSQNPLWETNDCALKQSWFCAKCYNELTRQANEHKTNMLGLYGWSDDETD